MEEISYLCVIAVTILHHLVLISGEVTISDLQGNPLPNDYTVTVGKEINIVCESDHWSRTLWYHNGQQLDGIEDEIVIRATTQSGTTKSFLKLARVTLTTSGLYTCQNPNNHNEFEKVSINVVSHSTGKEVSIVEPDREHLEVEVGRGFTLKCVGDVGTRLEWLHEGTSLEENNRILLTGAQDMNTHEEILILSVMVSSSHHSGKYRCQDVVDTHIADEIDIVVSSEASRAASVEIVVPSTRSVILRLGQPITIQCAVDLSQSIIWYVNGTMLGLIENQPVISMLTDKSSGKKISRLSYDSATYSMDGIYQCKNTRDPKDRDEVTIAVISQDAEMPGDSGVPTKKTTVTLRVGHTIDLKCSLEGHDISHNPEWLKGDVVLTPSIKHVISRGSPSALKIQSANRDDIGVYRCNFKDKTTGEIKASVVFNVTTIPCTPLTAPENGSFDHCPEKPVFGEHCSFKCESGSKLSNKRPLLCDATETGMTHWSDVVPKCRPSDGDLSDIAVSVSHVLLRVGGAQKLQCSQGSSWNRNGITIKSDDKYAIENNALVIKETVKEDTGVYECYIRRKLEADQSLIGIKKFNVTTLPCPVLAHPINGTITRCHALSPVYGETCIFTCDKGFKLYGSRSRTCELSHTQTQVYWTGTHAECQNTKYLWLLSNSKGFAISSQFSSILLSLILGLYFTLKS